jgi:hypothetical protein
MSMARVLWGARLSLSLAEGRKIDFGILGSGVHVVNSGFAIPQTCYA